MDSLNIDSCHKSAPLYPFPPINDPLPYLPAGPRIWLGALHSTHSSALRPSQLEKKFFPYFGALHLKYG